MYMHVYAMLIGYIVDTSNAYVSLLSMVVAILLYSIVATCTCIHTTYT